jgi:hypothetical protein
MSISQKPLRHQEHIIYKKFLSGGLLDILDCKVGYFSRVPQLTCLSDKITSMSGAKLLMQRSARSPDPASVLITPQQAVLLA